MDLDPLLGFLPVWLPLADTYLRHLLPSAWRKRERDVSPARIPQLTVAEGSYLARPSPILLAEKSLQIWMILRGLRGGLPRISLFEKRIRNFLPVLSGVFPITGTA